jgi:adenine-specific DNA-methyltransferase
MADPLKPYGPNNPHPLSVVRSELVWEGKYDEYGNRRSLDTLGLAMPLQKIETIDEPRARQEAQGGLFDTQNSHLDDFRNRLIWGDNKLITASLLHEYRDQASLIYIDPPFDVGADFTMTVPIGDGSDEVTKAQSALEMVAYRDTWGRGADSYLHMMYERLVLMRELLNERGSLFVHCDWRMNSSLRLVLDDVFGRENFVNEIIWKRSDSHSDTKGKFARVTDSILFYRKSEHHSWRPQYLPLPQKTVDDWYKHVDEATGRRYNLDNCSSPNPRPNMMYEYKGVKSPPKGWRYSLERMKELDAAGRLHITDKTIKYKRYLDESKGVVMSDLWADISQIRGYGITSEAVDYSTQKPEALLERIIRAGSDEGDLVLDLFCGSGTLASAAEKLGRRWIVADLGRFAVHTTRKRMIEVQRKLFEEQKQYRAFDVFNLGRYERQWWQRERLAGADDEHRRIVLEFFRAEQMANPPSPLLHGRKGGALCHVDSIDSIFTREEAQTVAADAAAAGAKEVVCLSWEFEMDLRLECDRLEKELGIAIKLIPIPREIMEKNRKEPPPFLEVATLSAEPVLIKAGGHTVVDIKLTSFIPSLAEVPSRELAVLKERAITSGFDFIDFWAVDFDFSHGGAFHHDWQDYRLRKDRSLRLQSEQRHAYDSAGTYTACVKVVDIFGCDTSISVKVDYA